MTLNVSRKIESLLADFMSKHIVWYNFIVAMCLLSWTLILGYLSYNYTVEFKQRGPTIQSLVEWRASVDAQLEELRNTK